MAERRASRWALLVVALLLLFGALARWLWGHSSGDVPASAPTTGDGGRPAPPTLATSSGRLPALGRDSRTAQESGRAQIESPRPSRDLAADEWRLWGDVRDESGAGIAGATVRLRLHGAGSVIDILATSIEGGSFEAFTNAPDAWGAAARSSAFVVCGATAKGYRPAEPVDRTFEDREGRHLGFGLVLRRGACIRGRVVSTDGTPAAGAPVTTCAGGEVLSAVVTGPDGRFELDAERAGPAIVRVSSWVHGFAVQRIDVDQSRDVDVGDLVLAPAGTIEGRTEFPDGRPARFVRMEIAQRLPKGTLGRCDEGPGLDYAVESDERGRFRIVGLAEGTYDLRAGTGDEGVTDIRVGRRDVVVTLRARRIVVLARDDAGRRVSGVELSLVGLDGKATDVGSTDWGESQASLGVSGEGRYGIRGHTRGAVSDLVPVEVPALPGETEAIVVLRQDAAARVDVRVKRPDGSRVDEYNASLRSRTPDREMAWWIGADRLSPAVRAGSYVLSVVPGWPDAENNGMFALDERVLELAAGETKEIDVVALPGGRPAFTFRVLPDPFPIGSLKIVLQPANDGPSLDFMAEDLRDEAKRSSLPSPLVMRDVRYVLRIPIRPGTWHAAVTAEGCAPFETSFHIEAENVTEVDVRLAPK